MINKMFRDRKPLILVVDDSRFMRITFRNFLEEEGYDVIEAENGMEAIVLFKSEKPDVVLMDYVMPEMNGVITCENLQRLDNGRDTPVIMITSLEDESSVNLAFEAGATDYISKPINWAVLRQRLSRLIQARKTKKILNQSEAFSKSIIDHAVEGILTVDTEGIVTYSNPAAERILGYTDGEIMEKNISMFFESLNYSDFYSKKNEDKFVWNNKEVIVKRKDYSNLPVEITISKFNVDESLYFTIIMRDITERKRYEETIKYQAYYDSLTGLPNRSLLKDSIATQISNCNKNGTKFAVMFLDLDRFKLVNDTLGHDIGDKLLREVAIRLKDDVGEHNIIARIGGDEFVVLMEEFMDEEYARQVANKILDTIRQPIIIDKHELFLTISIGIAIYPRDGEDEESLLTNADVAMYRAKEEGKNNFQLYTPALNIKALERLSIGNSLRRALEYNEFIVHYQPKVDAKTESIVGMEALVRWQHPQWGIISPLRFIPIAEETGLIVPLGEWVLRTACTHNKALQNSGLPPLTVSVNLSSRQFELQNLTYIVEKALKETGLEPKYLELEITESIAMQNIDHTIKTISEIRELGVKFSIDDFGTGYSSLSQLSNLSVNKLKIDRSFVKKVGGHKNDSIIASTVLALGKGLELGVVAEGVENQEQANFFKKNDCDEMQGYFFGKPMTGEQFKSFYRENLQRFPKIIY